MVSNAAHDGYRLTFFFFTSRICNVNVISHISMKQKISCFQNCRQVNN